MLLFSCLECKLLYFNCVFWDNTNVSFPLGKLSQNYNLPFEDRIYGNSIYSYKKLFLANLFLDKLHQLYDETDFWGGLVVNKLRQLVLINGFDKLFYTTGDSFAWH